MACFRKSTLFVLNFLVLGIGVAVIILASLVIHRSHQYGDLFISGIMTLPIWTLVFGIGITIIGFFGCCGALRENKCMLYTYAGIVLVLFLAELVLGILILVYPEQAKTIVHDEMVKSFKKYGDTDADKKAIDSLQHELQCCGVDSSADWANFGMEIPASCCTDHSDKCPPSEVYNQGCFPAFVNEIQSIAIGLGVAAIVLALIQVFCIVVACGLGRTRYEMV